MPEQQKGRFLDFKPSAPMRPPVAPSAPSLSRTRPAPSTPTTPVSGQRPIARSPLTPAPRPVATTTGVALPHLQPLGMPTPAKTQAAQASFPAVGMTLNSYSTQKNQTSLSSTGSRHMSPADAPGDVVKRQSAGSSGRNRNRNNGPKKEKKHNGKRIWKRIMWIIILIVALGGGWFGWKVLYNLHKVFGNSVFSAFNTTHLNGEASGRVNILLAGNSVDDAGHQGAALTDSIMVLSVDTRNNSAFMLSIPRDMYVDVDHDGHNKINTVYPTGESEKFNESGYAPGGMGLLEKTIKEDFGITCQYYALVSYDALKQAVDSVGGINFTVHSSDARGLYDPSKSYDENKILVKLSNGTHHLNGVQALDLARARGDAPHSYGFNSDFTRAQNQRELILALRTKAMSAGVLTNPVKLASLFDALGSNIKTDLTLADVRRLYDLTKNTSNGGVQSVGLNDAGGKNLLANYNSGNAGSALIPAAGLDDYSDIQKYLEQIMSSSPLTREGAQIVVLNGTSTSGLAAYEQNRLTKKGFIVDSVGDALNQEAATTQIINISGKTKPGTLAALKKVYTSASVTTTNAYSTKYPDADFIVVIGANRIQPDTAAMHSSLTSVD